MRLRAPSAVARSARSARSSHSPTSSRLRSGERLATMPGATISFDEKITPPMMRSLRDRGAQAPARIEKAEVGRRRMIGAKPDIVPPGNPVLREHHGGIVAQQRRQACGERADPGRLQRADDDILRAQRRGIVGGFDPGRERGVADPQRQAFGLHRFEMRSAHHAGHFMACQREPHRKMAADGARAENADTHGVRCPG